MSVAEALLAFLVMGIGAAIQGAVGFGSNLFAAPVLVLIDAELVPVPVIISSLALNTLVMRRERAPHAWREMRWPIAVQLPGAIVGAFVLSIIARDHLATFFAVMVLLAVALSVSGLHPRRTPGVLTVAGLVSAFMGTTVGIGGPPMALLYQKATGPEIRAALSRFFTAQAVISLAMLAVFGELEIDDLWNGLMLLPGVAAGYLVSNRLLTHVDQTHIRVAVLSLSAVSAGIALMKALA